MSIPYAEAALQRYSHENVPRKVPPNPQENTHAEARHQKIRRAAYSSRTPTRTLPHKHLKSTPSAPQEHSQRTAPACIQKSKLI